MLGTALLFQSHRILIYLPIATDFRSGFYIFPVHLPSFNLSGWFSLTIPADPALFVQPTNDNIIKCGRHTSGVVYHPPGNTNTDRPISTPRTVSSHGDDGLRVPRSSLRRLRSLLRGTYPELAEKPFAATRLCW